jgi:hypothetical protein
MLLRDFVMDFEIVPVAHVVTGMTFVFTLHICCILLQGLCILRSLRLLS